MQGNLLKSLLSKGRAAMLGGDEAMAGAGKFRSGGKGPWGQTAGGARTNMSAGLDDGLNAGTLPSAGPVGMPMQTMRPLNEMDKIKMLLARMTPEQKAALLGAGGGLAAGGLGGYMAGGEEE
jgi:hypothetical protein